MTRPLLPFQCVSAVSTFALLKTLCPLRKMGSRGVMGQGGDGHQGASNPQTPYSLGM